MMDSLAAWSQGERQLTAAQASVVARRTPLIEQSAAIELDKFMGRWFVVAAIPTLVDKGAVNSIEDYSWNGRSQRVEISFKMQVTMG